MLRIVFRILILILLVEAGASADTRFTHVPVNVAGQLLDYIFLDVTGDDVADLLALSRNSKGLAVQIHHTRRGIGFSSDPNQIIQLPKETMAVWAGTYPAPIGKAIVALTVDGVFYLPGRKNYFPNVRWKSLYATRCWDLRNIQEPAWMPFIQPRRDGALELIVPEQDGFKVVIKSSRNSSASLLLPVDFSVISMAAGKYTEGKPWLGLLWKDINHDGSLDLVWVDEKHCRFVLGSKNGLSGGIKGGLDIPGATHVLAVSEATGDGVPDVFLERNSEPGFFKTKELDVLLISGRRDGMRISFAENPDQVWEFKGVQVVPRVVDYNA
ncbi:MAG: VCBS repeat-containing protein, partial [Chlorobi bacterium]|nr:VCBS repeat-containing protein [Chlorobiota bacterium]